MRGLETLRANDRDSAQIGVMERAGDAFRRQTMATLRIAFLSALVLELVAMLAVALVAGTVGVQLAEGDLGLETGLAVLILAPELYMPVRLLGQQFHASQDGMAAAERMFAVLDEPPAVSVPDTSLPRPDPARGAREPRRGHRALPRTAGPGPGGLLAHPRARRARGAHRPERRGQEHRRVRRAPAPRSHGRQRAM